MVLWYEQSCWSRQSHTCLRAQCFQIWLEHSGDGMTLSHQILFWEPWSKLRGSGKVTGIKQLLVSAVRDPDELGSPQHRCTLERTSELFKPHMHPLIMIMYVRHSLPFLSHPFSRYVPMLFKLLEYSKLMWICITRSDLKQICFMS